MSCQSTLKQMESAGVSMQSQEMPNPPAEIFGDTRTVSKKHEEAMKLALQRGQHKVSVVIDYEGEPKTVDNVAKKLDVQGEFKRIFYHKIDIRPISDSKAQMTAVFHVLDNPIPLVPIVWGATIVSSATAGYFLVDKVESFTSTIGGKVSIVLTAIVAYFTIFKNG